MKKAVIVTGASGSMGSEAVRSLAAAGCAVIMACRNMEKAKAVRRTIVSKTNSNDIHMLQLDVSSFSSIRSFVSSVAVLCEEKHLVLTGLFNNAGIINREYGLSADGYERTLATNYIGPYLLTRLLIPMMADGSHIVNMVSLTCRFGNVDETLFARGPERFRQLGTYADSKLALLLFSISLSEKVDALAEGKHIYINVADPGVVNSNMLSMGKWYDSLADILFRPFCKSPAKGAGPAIKAISANGSMRYYKGRNFKDIQYSYKMHPSKEWLWKETASKFGL